MRRFFCVPFVALLLAGCTWGQLGGTAGRSFDNRYDKALTVNNVSGLVERFTVSAGTGDLRQPVVGGGLLLTGDRAGLHAFRATGCSGNGVPSCAAVWNVAGSFSDPVTDGSHVFAADTSGAVLHALDLNGVQQWRYTIPSVANRTSTFGSWLTLAGGDVWAPVIDADGVTADVGRIVRLSAGGCGNATCGSTLTIPTTSGVQAVSVDDGRVFVTMSGVLNAFASSTGALQWQSSASSAVAGTAVVRDGIVLARQVSGGHSNPAYGFSAAPGATCSGSPLRCTPIAQFELRGSLFLVISEHHVAWPGGVDSGPLLWVDKDIATACAPPGDCFGSAATSLPGVGFPGGGVVAAAGGVMYLGALNHIAAIDESAPTNCATKCNQLWSATLSNSVQGIAIVGGFVYLTESDGLIHAYGLPPT